MVGQYTVVNTQGWSLVIGWPILLLHTHYLVGYTQVTVIGHGYWLRHWLVTLANTSLGHCWVIGHIGQWLSHWSLALVILGWVIGRQGRQYC